ncbi:MAG: ABC transporter permease [Gammaproteobacteria bacterium]|nr:ABC transporter permease [Gammaproteobacteria bacterium]
MNNFSYSPAALVASPWRHRQLIAALVKREVLARYRGSALGMLWSFFNPLFMLAVYTFVFSVVFKARWDGGESSKSEFALLLFAGMIVFNLFADCINRAPGVIIANTNFVKKVVFPLDILPWVTLLAALFHLSISLGVWLLFHLIFFGLPSLSLALFPLVIMPLALMILGLSWFLASLGVYLRDVGQIMGVLTTALLFLSPIFYPVAALPPAYQTWIHLNPLTPVIEQARQVLFYGGSLALYPWAIQFGLGLLIAWLGYLWFQKTRKGFADVL